MCYISQYKCVKASFGCHVASALRGMKSGGRKDHYLGDCVRPGELARHPESGTVLVLMDWVWDVFWR